MKHYTHLAILLCCLFFISACGSKKPAPLPVPQWNYERDAITIRLKSNQLLNQNEGVPHTLMIGLYQLRNKHMFEQLAANQDGLYQLLDCKPFDTSVTSVKRLFVQPDQDITIVMDRLAGTKHIAIVAGYMVLQQTRMVRIIDVPVLYSADKKTAKADKLQLVVNLGSEQIAAVLKR